MLGGKCLITGCALVFPQDETAHWGDLHEFEGLYIFNAVTTPKGEPCLVDPHQGDKHIFVNSDAAIAQHNGLFLIPQSLAYLNFAASSHIAYSTLKVPQ